MDNKINIARNEIVKHLGYLFRVVLICSASTFVSVLLNNMGIDKENSLMVFLIGVLTVTSVTRGYVYGAVSSVLSVLLFNYFLTQPLHTLLISYSQDIILIVFFLTASLISSKLTSKLQHQTEVAKRNERISKLLYEITKGFLDVTGKENVVLRGIRYINDYAGYKCYVRLKDEDEIYHSEGLPESFDELECLDIPIKGMANQIGTMSVVNMKLPMLPESSMIIKTIVYQMALVLDREFIYNEREKIKVAMESERLKSTLLRSISHDLRTPLTGIIGACELILYGEDDLDSGFVKKLAEDIKEESTWLIKSVQNILDMTRISEGYMTVNKDYEAVDDLINETLKLVPQLVNSGRLHVSPPENIILLFADGHLIVQALANLLDNAYKHSGEDTQIFLSVHGDESKVVFIVKDNGSGIDLSLGDKLFDGFVTQHKNVADGYRGVGLGLAICKAIVTAHNGTISAGNNDSGGAIFKITLPLEGTLFEQ